MKIVTNINRIMKKSISEKTLRNLLVCVFIGTLIPLFFIGKYDFPSVDDFAFAAEPKSLWNEYHNLFVLIKQAVIQAYQMFFVWEGRFAVNFLLALNPIIWGEEYYALGTIAIICILICAVMFFSYTLFGKIFGANLNQWFSIALIWLFLDIQFLPSAVQGFYWYTGAVGYTVMHAISLLLYGLMILLVLNEKKMSNLKKFLYQCVICLLSIVTGGGSYISAIVTFFVFAAIIIIQFIKKENYKIYILPYILYLIAFVMNVLAPGNLVRAEGKLGTGIFQSGYLTIIYAVEKMNEWLNLPVILICACAIPILVNIIKKTDYNFKYPIAVSMVSIILFVVQFFPHVYAMASIGPDRLLNVIYFSFSLGLLFNIFYWGGWIYHKYEFGFQTEKESRHSLYSICAIGASLLLCCVALKTEFPSTSVAAVYSIATGESQNYHKENQERLLVLKDENQKDVELKAHRYKPMILFGDDGNEEPENWRNEVMAGFYGKETVVVKD